MKTVALLAAIITVGLIADAKAATWQLCGPGHHCTPIHRVYRIRCGAWLWLSPKPVQVPYAIRWNKRERWWCYANIPAFPA